MHCRCECRAAVSVVPLWASCRCERHVSAGRFALGALPLWVYTRAQSVSSECVAGVGVVPLWASCAVPLSALPLRALRLVWSVSSEIAAAVGCVAYTERTL